MERTLGEDLVDAIKGATTGEIHVERGGLRARATVRGAGPYGAELDGLSVQRGAPGDAQGRARRTKEVARGIAQTVDYLAEPLEVLEMAPQQGRAQLRTRRERVRKGEYYELDVHDGDRVDVRRARWSPETRRQSTIPQAFAHDTLRRLVDDLGDLIDRTAVEPQD